MKNCIICNRKFQGHHLAKSCSDNCSRLRKNQTNYKYNNKPEIKKRKQSVKYKEIAKKSDQQWYLKNKCKKLAYNAAWKAANVDYNREWYRNYKYNREKTDINFKLANKLRTRLWYAIKNNQKTGSAISDLGCSIKELKKHLEAQFQIGMSWYNWTTDGWHIDHKVALANFDHPILNNLKKLVIIPTYSLCGLKII